MSEMLLATWNVLADAYIRPKYYPRTDRALLAPGARTAAVVERLSGLDVACLQEVEPAVVAALTGWHVAYAQKPGKPEGCAIVSRTPFPWHSVALPDAQVAVVVRTDVGLIATTHVRWDAPGTPRGQRQAVREVDVLLAALDEERCLVCGDFNVVPEDEVCAMFVAAGFRDACAGLGPTANPSGRAKRIDHVFVRGGLVATPRPLVPIDDTTPLPSADMPSDHVPIVVDVIR